MRTNFERYRAIGDQLAGLIGKTDVAAARRATAAALLHHKLRDVSWTGFYLLRGDDLVVDVYQGPVACLVLPGRAGVCWAGVVRGGPVIVPDVHAYPGHVPCDARSRSEIVLPHRGPDGKILGVLDLDSRRPDRFDEEDAAGLDLVLAVLEGRDR